MKTSGRKPFSVHQPEAFDTVRIMAARTKAGISRVRRRLLLSALALVLFAGACTSRPAYDSAVLATERVAVTGFAYRAVDSDERRSQLDGVPDGTVSAAFHTIHRTGSDAEIAFLVQYELSAGDAAGMEETFGPDAIADGWTGLQLAGHTVFSTQNPSAPMSFHLYMWKRGPVLGYVDGPNDMGPELRQWIEAYFAAVP